MMPCLRGFDTGENQPVSGEQLTNVFENSGIQEIAQKLGISGAAAQSGLVASLPRFIDKHTPDRTARRETCSRKV